MRATKIEIEHPLRRKKISTSEQSIDSASDEFDAGGEKEPASKDQIATSL